METGAPLSREEHDFKELIVDSDSLKVKDSTDKISDTENKKNNTPRTRNVGLDFVRLLACLMVIEMHTCLPVKEGKDFRYCRVVIQCLVGDGVTFFWVLSGWNMFSNYNYSKRLKSLVRKHVLPMLLVMVFSFYCSDHLLKGTSWSKSFNRTASHYKAVWNKVAIGKEPPIPALSQLWFMIVYIPMVIWSPLLNGIAQWIDSDKKNEYWFVGITIFTFIWNDCVSNKLLRFNFAVSGAISAVILLNYGHIFRKHYMFFTENRFSGVIGLTMYLGVNYIRSLLQFSDDLNGLGEHKLYWYTSFSVFCSCGLIMFSCRLFRKVSDKSILGRIIVFLTSHSFTTYLLHWYVKDLANKHFGFQNKVKKYVFAKGDGWFYDVQYTVIVVFSVFAVCCLVGEVLRAVKQMILRFFSFVNKKIKTF